MLIYLLRHGQTEYNAQKRYQGQRDIPLSPEGAAQLCRADFDPAVVYVSTLQRTSQTARILFPEAKLVPVDGLKEMCFGSFEGRNFIEMEKDPEYQAWVKANCESPCPDGERKTDFSDRICRTVAERCFYVLTPFRRLSAFSPRRPRAYMTAIRIASRGGYPKRWFPQCSWNHTSGVPSGAWSRNMKLASSTGLRK